MTRIEQMATAMQVALANTGTEVKRGGGLTGRDVLLLFLREAWKAGLEGMDPDAEAPET